MGGYCVLAEGDHGEGGQGDFTAYLSSNNPFPSPQSYNISISNL